MNLDAIKIFIATYRAGNFAAVAKELNVAASSISRSVAALEVELKTRLFNRTTRKLSPTIEGEIYYHRVIPLLEEFERLEQDLQVKSVLPTGKIKITASTTYGQIVLAPLLKKFHRLYPDIFIELVLSDGHLDMVSEQIDLAIRHGAMPDSNLIARKLTDVNYYLVATPDFLASAGEILSPEDISSHPLVTFTYREFLKSWNFKRGTKEVSVKIEPQLTISNAAAIRECIKNNFGMAILADWTISSDIEAGNLVRILPDWSVSINDEDSTIWLVQQSRSFIPEKIQVFKEFLIAHC